jgi:signal recognition particle subunit SRP54
VDVYRPAARKQLEILARDLKLPIYMGENDNPLDIAKGARREAMQTGRDTLLVDTAGRLHIDDELMKELEGLKTALNPTEILFVADAMTGQDAVRSAEEFHKRLSVTGIILTKMDGDARGGAALSIRQVTGQPLKFVGIGEKPDAFEPFHPDRVAQRILGMGDVLSFIEKVQGEMDMKEAEKMQQKLLDDDFTLGDFRDQLKQLSKLGGLDSILGMLPNMGPIKALKEAKVDPKEIGRTIAIVNSMTLAEQRNHMIINGQRRRRIAKGSGTTVQEVNSLLKQYAEARKMMKTLSGGMKSGGFLSKRMGKMDISKLMRGGF